MTEQTAEEILCDEVDIKTPGMLIDVIKDLKELIRAGKMKQVSGNILIDAICLKSQFNEDHISICFESVPGGTKYFLICNGERSVGGLFGKGTLKEWHEEQRQKTIRARIHTIEGQTKPSVPKIGPILISIPASFKTTEEMLCDEAKIPTPEALIEVINDLKKIIGEGKMKQVGGNVLIDAIPSELPFKQDHIFICFESIPGGTKYFLRSNTERGSEGLFAKGTLKEWHNANIKKIISARTNNREE